MMRIVVLLLAFLAAATPVVGQTRPDAPKVDPKWLDRMPRQDRQWLDSLLDEPAPAFTEDLDWRGRDALTWKTLRGRVVVIQTFNTGTGPGRKVLNRWEKRLAKLDQEQVAVLLLHTPEKADGLEAYLKRRPIELQLTVDPTGAFCDELAAYKRPVNYLIDRAGRIRFAGINERGFTEALAQLIAEPLPPEESGDEEVAPEESDRVEFPPIDDEITGAVDWRWKRGPEFAIDRWKTDAPNAEGRLVAIVFWEPGIDGGEEAIPVLDELARFERGMVCVVALSADSPSGFSREMTEANLDEDDFVFSVALDAKQRMKSEVRPERQPYLVLFGRDWVVRWQGLPHSLTQDLVRQIDAADRASQASTGTGKPQKDRRRYRWTKGGG